MIASSKQEYIEKLKTKLTTDPRWAEAALLRIYNAQTAAEQASGSVRVFNGVGFTGNDATYYTSLAKQLKANGRLSDKQRQMLMMNDPAKPRRGIQKYAGQLLEYCLQAGTVKKVNGFYTDELNKPAPVQNDDRDWIEMKNEFARQERIQEMQAFASDPDYQRSLMED